MDQTAQLGWGAYWGEAQSVGFILLLPSKVMVNEIIINEINLK